MPGYSALNYCRASEREQRQNWRLQCLRSVAERFDGIAVITAADGNGLLTLANHIYDWRGHCPLPPWLYIAKAFKRIARQGPNPLFASPHQLQPELNLPGGSGSG